MPAALARRRTIFQALMRFSRSPSVPAAHAHRGDAWWPGRGGPWGFAQPGMLDVFGEVASSVWWQGISWNLLAQGLRAIAQ